jgi:hypothetical protein
MDKKSDMSAWKEWNKKYKKKRGEKDYEDAGEAAKKGLRSRLGSLRKLFGSSDKKED